MLHLYRRHLESCGRKKRVANCSCPIWVQGRLHGRLLRKSLGIRNWESAQSIVRDWEANKAGSIPLGVAFARFIADCGARKLSPETIYKYRVLEKEMVAVFEETMVDAVSIDALSSYRESWKLGTLTARNKVDLMRRFFNFCVERGWCKVNPASQLKAPKGDVEPTLPFSDAEIKKIMGAVELYPDRPKGRRAQLRAFVLVLRYTGLRIGDVVRFGKEKISDGKIMLRTAKTGQMVWIPVPNFVEGELAGLGERPFWSGNGLGKNGVKTWERSFRLLFKLAGVTGHPHMFRTTFAVNLLQSGVSLENVATLLGNTVRVAEKHYAPYVQTRQVALEAEVRKTFGA
jgi:site-specific recombinase XerD